MRPGALICLLGAATFNSTVKIPRVSFTHDCSFLRRWRSSSLLQYVGTNRGASCGSCRIVESRTGVNQANSHLFLPVLVTRSLYIINIRAQNLDLFLQCFRFFFHLVAILNQFMARLVHRILTPHIMRSYVNPCFHLA